MTQNNKFEDDGGINKGFEFLLMFERVRAQSATGLTEKDYKYGVAQEVKAAGYGDMVFVRYNDIEYGPAEQTWGPLDGSEEKMTVLVNAKKTDSDAEPNNWTKLEYFKADIKPFVPRKR